jgi:hypothetical protein
MSTRQRLGVAVLSTFGATSLVLVAAPGVLTAQVFEADADCTGIRVEASAFEATQVNVLTITVNGQAQSWTFGDAADRFVPFVAGQRNTWSWSVDAPGSERDSSGSGVTAGCSSAAITTIPTAPTSTTTTAPPPLPTTTVSVEQSESTPPAEIPLPQAGEVQFFEDFQSPQGFTDRFESQVFFGTDDPPDVTEWMGDHDLDCGGPETLRPVHAENRQEMIWWCAPRGAASGHIMTSMFTTGYAHVDFAPNQSFSDVSRVCWDQNLTELGGRKWTQVVVVPESTYEEHDGHMEYVIPELQNDVAVNGINLEGDTFLFRMLRGSTSTFVGQHTADVNFSGYTTPDKARRFRTCLTDLEDGTVEIELQRESTVDVRIQQGSFPDGEARVIFQDVSYDPPKDPLSTNQLATWHWDNIEIA